jgi:lactoylglutathione lyase
MKNLKENFRGLAHICVFTANMNKSLHFYEDALCFEKTYETLVRDNNMGDTKYVLIKNGNLVIELLQPTNPENIHENVKGTFDHIAIEVKNLYLVVDDLKNKKIKFNSEVFLLPDLLNGCRGVFISGPNGEWIELFEYLA